mmetsp:Transcript_50557/g.110014  ORF Transcript_50557/g.110014 Transcript_50557/m.110014 type:complete len:185 (+) Transcript_50557:122-676(+)
MAEVAEEGEQACAIEAENCSGRLRFCQAPRYLFYIVAELLRNSARASRDAAGGDLEELAARPIRVSLCADESLVVIRVSDRGGGMPSRVAKEMWSYTFPETPDAHKGQPYCLLPSVSSVMDGGYASAAQGGPWGVFCGDTPLSGRGIGLQLSRLYALHVGGSLQVINMPGLGVDAYLFLHRLEA